jgi:hypothetical protein
MNDYIAYIVTGFGFLLATFAMIFIFIGKSVSNNDNKQQLIKLYGIEARTNSIIAILFLSLITATLPMILQFIGVHTKSNSDPLVSEKTCNTLKGKYRLYTDYDFINTRDMKATIRNGTWIADKCEKLDDGTFILEGSDTSHHEIELIIKEALNKSRGLLR